MLRKILIVDDIELNRTILKNGLQDKYEVIEAANGEEALNLVKNNYKDISAVLMDINMPVMDGYEALRQIRLIPVLSQLPVIFVTGYEEESARLKALSSGANDFIIKPYNLELILHCLHNNIALREAAAIANSSLRDELTGLYNRSTFFEEASKKIESQELGYYMITCFDIENFKVINDQYGMEKGDEVLKHVANCISDCSAEIDGICGRVMADKFVVLFHAKDVNSEIILKTHSKITSPACIENKIKLRYGRYIVDDLSIPVNSMFDRATMAEESIKGCYDKYIAYYTESMRNKILQEQQVVSDMSEALQNRDFEVWFQPQYNHSTGALIGAEALIRWRHVNQGLIPPGKFIPVFERNGFVYEVDKFVWEETCRLLRHNIDIGKNVLPISVNVSRVDIFKDDFFEFITGLIGKYNLPIEFLRLEITESAFSDASEYIVTTVKKLVEFGFTVEIDDFGSGYSSLNTLKDVPAQILKLDMKFLQGNENSDRAGNIIESIVRMAKWLKMSVIAEGVEFKEQADYLKTIGCYYIQGYYYAKPMPLEQFMECLENSDKEKELSSVKTVATYDNISFWNPKSIETLIFNSYVGGACVTELHNNKLEIIRSNDRFRQEFGERYINGVHVSEVGFGELLDNENMKIFIGNIHNAINKSKESSCEVKTKVLEGGNGEPLYIRIISRVIAQTEERYLCYNVLVNITDLRVAEQKERVVSEHIRAIMDNVNCGITAAFVLGGKSELIFANDRFFEILGYTREEYGIQISNNSSFIHPDDVKRVFNDIEQFDKIDEKITLEYRVKHKDGHYFWLSVDVSMTYFADIEAPVKIGIYNDITEEKEADEQLQFLNRLSRAILEQPDVENGLKKAMKSVLSYFDGDRAFFYEIDEETKTMKNTRELCADNIIPEQKNRQNVPFEVVDIWMKELKSNGYVDIEDVNELGEDKENQRQWLKKYGLTSFVAAPLCHNGKYMGFVGVENPRRKWIKTGRLSAIGDYAMFMLARRDYKESLNDEKNALVAIMDGIPGGFARLKFLSNGNNGMIVPLYYSKSFSNLTGMSNQQLMNISQNNALNIIHPADINIFRDAVDKMNINDEGQTLKVRILCADEKYKEVSIFGKMRKSSFGENFLNIYYTDEKIKISV